MWTSPVAFAFEKLLVYQKSVDFADSICEHTEKFARGYGFLVDQLNRAALSIAANIAEGNGRFTKPDRNRQIPRQAFGASAETKPVDRAPTQQVEAAVQIGRAKSFQIDRRTCRARVV